MKNKLHAILDRFGLKQYAFLPVDDGTLIAYFVPYAPFDYSDALDSLQIDSYYLVSNRAYFQNLILLETLNAEGFNAVRYRRTDIKELLLRHRLADRGLNSLCFVKDLGSFFFVATILLRDFHVQFFSSIPPTPPLCTRCGLCLNACPQNALTVNGFVKDKCLRQMQEAYSDTPEINAALRKNGKLLGCNVCQTACPLNANIKSVKPPQELVVMCDKKNILKTAHCSEGLQKLTPLIGKNYAREVFLLPLVLAILNTQAKNSNFDNQTSNPAD